MTYANIRPANMFDMLTDIQHVLVFNLLEPFPGSFTFGTWKNKKISIFIVLIHIY